MAEEAISKTGDAEFFFTLNSPSPPKKPQVIYRDCTDSVSSFTCDEQVVRDEAAT